MAERFQQAAGIEPRHPFQRRVFHVVEAAPWPRLADDLRLEEADHGFRERIVVRIAPAADRGLPLDECPNRRLSELAEYDRETDAGLVHHCDRGLQPEFNSSSQQYQRDVAGWANQRADPKGRAGMPGRWWSKAPYGDDPDDQAMIKAGIEYYKRCEKC